VWWDSRVVLDIIGGFTARARPRIWLDIGTDEGSNPEKAVEEARMLRVALAEKGWKDGVNLCYREFPGAGHNERASGRALGRSCSACSGDRGEKPSSRKWTQRIAK
jgi:predicted alpha/beta superfamily hydrolase